MRNERLYTYEVKRFSQARMQTKPNKEGSLTVRCWLSPMGWNLMDSER